MVDADRVCGEFGWVEFLVACFLYKIISNPRNIICGGKKWPKCHFQPTNNTVLFAENLVGLGFLYFEVVRFLHKINPNPRKIIRTKRVSNCYIPKKFFVRVFD